MCLVCGNHNHKKIALHFLRYWVNVQKVQIVQCKNCMRFLRLLRQLGVSFFQDKTKQRKVSQES